ncbi:RsmB/NOP family class I SAM-dependent RNA methyltransferase [Butyrivibrio sp. VCD2006]|uniref:RsmB/NOP family class I SAM-dependent RNA methyltransferase n=1 Tax=Butyrivibrio sp. VCD2006 TaxID=1280664 RepID=UPI00041961A4|nr:RsmF rRNA methyltransferase first C-terminal domain-containing protein [Butyrivibrio sp. VCD2006]
MSFDINFENRIRALLLEDYPDFEKAISGEKISALRINPFKVTGLKNEVLDDLKNADIRITNEVDWEKNARVYSDGAPGKHPFHEAGLYYIQEPSAMAPVHYLDPKPGEKILDLCAAPGGKSTQIACRMNGEGILVTNEIDKKRAQILSLNIERLGIRNALVTNMRPEKLSEIFEGYFDKILVDAPCSGEGMFRKNDEAIDNWSLENVALCAKRQKDILIEAVKMLAPGGRLVYSTCTFAPEEDELQVHNLISMGLKPLDIQLFDGMERGKARYLESILNDGALSAISHPQDENNSLENIDKDLLDSSLSKCSVRLWPHRISGEGHFLAAFEKAGDITLNKGLYGINGKLKTVNSDDIKSFIEFANEFLVDVSFAEETAKRSDDSKGDKKNKSGKKGQRGAKSLVRIEGVFSGTPFMFGEQLYLAPEGMPGINGLSVMRPGLHLGTIKNGRFEPSHALALTLSKENVKLTYELSEKSMQFIGGMSFREADMQNGWYLVTTAGYSLGWAKYAGGIFKNHYPKGLRIYT